MIYMAPMIHLTKVIAVKNSLDTGEYQIGVRMIKLPGFTLKLLGQMLHFQSLFLPICYPSQLSYDLILLTPS